MNTAVNWFEIPVSSFERALRFYSEVFSAELSVIEMETRKLALMPPGADPTGDTSPGGALNLQPGFEPSDKGTIVYLDPGEGIDDVLGRVEGAGGKIATPKQRIGAGYLATFIDSEGNLVGLLEWDH